MCRGPSGPPFIGMALLIGPDKGDFDVKTILSEIVWTGVSGELINKIIEILLSEYSSLTNNTLYVN